MSFNRKLSLTIFKRKLILTKFIKKVLLTRKKIVKIKSI